MNKIAPDVCQALLDDKSCPIGPYESRGVDFRFEQE